MQDNGSDSTYLKNGPIHIFKEIYGAARVDSNKAFSREPGGFRENSNDDVVRVVVNLVCGVRKPSGFTWWRSLALGILRWIGRGAGRV